MTKIQISKNSKFDPTRAMELANLIERAYQQFDCHENNSTWEPIQSNHLIGSITCDSDLDHPSSMVEYEILSTFNFTEYWFGFREAVPFGFIVKRKLESGVPGIFVVFRGTRERAEWIDDFNANQLPFLGDDILGRVSHGFNKIYTRPNPNESLPNIEQTVLTTLQACPSNSQVFITGHSLGAALATLSSLHIANRTQFNSPILYSFASPRVGDHTFASKFGSLEHYRIANTEDIVPTLPFATGRLVGEDMFPDAKPTSPQQKGLESLRRLVGYFTGNLSQQVYEHVGEPVYFTDHRGTISFNHNMFRTYREALLSA